LVDVEKEDTSKVVLDVSKLQATGYHAKVSFEEGLKRIIKEGNK
jgi:nucleoside-diphosphate-sugar epimerase